MCIQTTWPSIALATAALFAMAMAAPVAASEQVAGHGQQLHSVDVAVYGTGGYPQYRIPALTVTNKGTLLAAYDARPHLADLPSNITILVRRSTNGGKTWEPVQILRSGPAPEGYGDTSFVVDRETGRIFAFYGASLPKSFSRSKGVNTRPGAYGSQADYSYSDDDGRTWHSRRITQQIKDPSWKSLSASSGQGIQIHSGKYKGRLVQQYSIRIGNGAYAGSAYSDDHGKTWKMGRPVGPGMNENKSVELADGTLMLNVRATPHRLVAYSHDGGETWSEPKPDMQQNDPGDNGSIIRYAPMAGLDDRRSHWLLLSNTDDPLQRRNLTVKMSCDDGRTWPISRVVRSGSSAYSTLVRLPNAGVGLFYEHGGYRYLTYASFGLDWLKGICAPLGVSSVGDVHAGAQASLNVTVVNQTDHIIDHGTISLQVPQGWKSANVHVRQLPAGSRRSVSVPFKPSITAAGDRTVGVRFTVGRRHSSLDVSIDVDPDPKAPAAPGLSTLANLAGVNAGGAAGILDDVAYYGLRVTNTGNTSLADINVTGDMDDLDKCHRGMLKPGETYTCTYASHAITRADMTKPAYRPGLAITAKAPDGNTVQSVLRSETLSMPQE